MRAYRKEGFPITIVRPSLTYGDTQITLAINSWAKSYTVVDRMRRGQKVIVPGDGSSLWVITHNSDFAKGLVGLLAREQAIGHAFHITSDEAMCWDQWYQIPRKRPALNHGFYIFPAISSRFAFPKLVAAYWATNLPAWSSITRRSNGSFPGTAQRCRSRWASGGPLPGSTPSHRGGRSMRKPILAGTS